MMKENGLVKIEKCVTSIEQIPTSIFENEIKPFLSRKEYDNLMNCNSTTFKSIKYETSVFKFCFPLSFDSKAAAFLQKITNTVKDKSKQIQLTFQGVQSQQLIRYSHLIQGVYSLSITLGQVKSNFDFTVFKNVNKVVLSGFKGVTSIESGFENVKSLTIKLMDSLQSIGNINFGRDLEDFEIVDCKKLKVIGFPLDKIKTKFDFSKSGFPTFQYPVVSIHHVTIDIKKPIPIQLRDFAPVIQCLDLVCKFPKDPTEISYLQTIPDLTANIVGEEVSFPDFLGKKLELICFDLSNWNQPTFQNGLSFANLCELKLYNCQGVKHLPPMPQLERLTLKHCPDISHLPSLPKLKKLSSTCCYVSFIAPDHPSLQEVSILMGRGVDNFSFAAHPMRSVVLYGSFSIPDISALKDVNKLEISTCACTTSFEGLSGTSPMDRRIVRLLGIELFNASLRFIHRLVLSAIFDLTDGELISDIDHLSIQHCKHFTTTKGLKRIRCSLSIESCPNCTSLVDVENIPLVKIKDLVVSDYSSLLKHEMRVIAETDLKIFVLNNKAVANEI